METDLFRAELAARPKSLMPVFVPTKVALAAVAKGPLTVSEIAPACSRKRCNLEGLAGSSASKKFSTTVCSAGASATFSISRGGGFCGS